MSDRVSPDRILRCSLVSALAAILSLASVVAWAAPCAAPTDCPSACQICSAGTCVDKPIKCTKTTGCAADEVCVLTTSQACDVYCTKKCSASADCGGGCNVCSDGGCETLPTECSKDADCFNGNVCKIVAGVPCQNSCVPPPCKTDGDCGICGSCKLGGACASVPGQCSDASQCGPYQNCQIDNIASCNNKCVGMACTVNGECGPCGQCKSGACTVPTPLCSKDADCGAGKVCEVDKNASCNNKCVVPLCKLDADCGTCGACNGGACLSVAPECSKDAGCAAGLVCQIDGAAPCQNKCVVASCKSDGDCGACGGCILGKCKIYKSECDTEGDCAKGQTCKFDANVGCKNACIAKPCSADVQCGPCFACTNGACAAIKPACVGNSDCAPGQSCMQDAMLPCLNACGIPPCKTSADCGSCQTCQAGICQDSAPKCQVDADCAQGTVCIVDAQQPCKNACLPPPCKVDGDCPSCQACTSGSCKAIVPACTKGADCAAGKYCLVDAAKPCKNTCQWPTCATDSDCGECTKCSAGGCQPVAPGCVDDGSCGVGKICVKDSQVACKASCQTAPCTKSEQCGSCGVCVAGACLAQSYVECTGNGDCSSKQVCKVVVGAACQNACVAKPGCSSDTDCGACQACENGSCGAAQQAACTKDAECGSGQVCKLEATACKNKCVVATCQVDADCPSCVTCVSGSCTGQGTVVCLVDGDCGFGKACKTSASSPCGNTCVTSGCKADGDCGSCGTCNGGVCGQLPAPCDEQGGCDAGQVCKIAPGEACKNQCELAVVTPDAGPPVAPDGGSAWDGGAIADAGAGTDDAASDDAAADAQAPDDAAADAQPDEDTASSEDAEVAEDVAVSQDAAVGQDIGAKSDGGPGQVDAGPTPADGGGIETEDDVGTEEPAPTATPAKSTWGCSAGGRADGSGWTILLAFAAGAVWLRRRRGVVA